jgi:hypothetical protein
VARTSTNTGAALTAGAFILHALIAGTLGLWLVVRVTMGFEAGLAVQWLTYRVLISLLLFMPSVFFIATLLNGKQRELTTRRTVFVVAHLVVAAAAFVLSGVLAL